MTVTGSQAAAHYQHQVSALSQLVVSYRELKAYFDAQTTALTEQIKQARRELAAVYLTELTDAAFARVAQLTGFKGFERRDPRQAIVHERKVLAASIASIESDERFARRDHLVGPVGTLTQELEGANETLKSLEPECAKFESQDGFIDLVNLGYDTPAFAEKWWSASYWKHWAAGDRICKALDMKDFGDDVLPAYKRVSEPRNFMRDEVRRITRAIDDVHDFTRQRDTAADRLANLESIYLAEAQDYLGEHLEGADSGLLEQWVAAEPDLQRAVQIGVRKLAGLLFKKRFAVDVGGNGVQQLVAQLEQKRQRAQAKVTKFQRPKNTYTSFPDTVIVRDFDQKAQSLTAQREKTQRRMDGLMAAQNYAGFDMRNDSELWWLYLTQSPPPRLAPSLFDYYQRRPSVQPITDPDFVDMGPAPGEAAAQAFVAGDLEQGTYLS